MFIDHNNTPHLGDPAPGEREATESEAAAFLTSHARLVARDAINDERDAALDAGVEWSGRRWHADTTFLTELLGRVMAWSIGLYLPEALKAVRTLDNEIMQLSRDEHIALAGAVGGYRETVYATSWAKKDML